MADLVRTICFRVSLDTWQKLKTMAWAENRKLGDLVRILVELALDVQKADSQ